MIDMTAGVGRRPCAQHPFDHVNPVSYSNQLGRSPLVANVSYPDRGCEGEIPQLSVQPTSIHQAPSRTFDSQARFALEESLQCRLCRPRCPTTEAN